MALSKYCVSENAFSQAFWGSNGSVLNLYIYPTYERLSLREQCPVVVGNEKGSALEMLTLCKLYMALDYF